MITPETINPLDPVTRSLGEKQYELSNHLGNVLVTVSDRKLAQGTTGSSATGFRAEVLFASDYYPFGMQMEARTFSSTSYIYGFNGKEKDDEWKGEGNSYDFGARMYDSRIGRWLSMDPKQGLLGNTSPYLISLNNALNVIDPNGEFPILINGAIDEEYERGSAKYWDDRILRTISESTGYELDQFRFVDGDQGFMPSTRKEDGALRAKMDAQDVWNEMKQSVNPEGQVTEQLQVISHSRGSVYGQAYMETLAKEIKVLAEKDGIGFAYDAGSIIEYSVNLAPHQSNSLEYEENGSKNINISHKTDPLSGNDATGNVLNIHSSHTNGSIDSHGNYSFMVELQNVLIVLENNENKDNLKSELEITYESLDWGSSGKSTIKEGK